MRTHPPGKQLTNEWRVAGDSGSAVPRDSPEFSDEGVAEPHPSLLTVLPRGTGADSAPKSALLASPLHGPACVQASKAPPVRRTAKAILNDIFIVYALRFGFRVGISGHVESRNMRRRRNPSEGLWNAHLRVSQKVPMLRSMQCECAPNDEKRHAGGHGPEQRDEERYPAHVDHAVDYALIHVRALRDNCAIRFHVPRHAE